MIDYFLSRRTIGKTWSCPDILIHFDEHENDFPRVRTISSSHPTKCLKMSRDASVQAQDSRRSQLQTPQRDIILGPDRWGKTSRREERQNNVNNISNSSQTKETSEGLQTVHCTRKQSISIFPHYKQSCGYS